MLIAHICCSHNIVTKTIHHVINITMTKAELFAIRCRINQVIYIANMLYIIVITDAIHLAKKYLTH